MCGAQLNFRGSRIETYFISSFIINRGDSFGALLCGGAQALKNYGRFLEIEGGRDCIVMHSGEKKTAERQKAHSRDCPLYTAKHFTRIIRQSRRSDAHRGVVHAGLCGRAYITVTDGHGRTDSILIEVTGGRKAGLIWLAAAAAIITAAVLFIRRITRTGCPSAHKNSDR